MRQEKTNLTNGQSGKTNRKKEKRLLVEWTALRCNHPGESLTPCMYGQFILVMSDERRCLKVKFSFNDAPINDLEQDVVSMIIQLR